MDRIDELQAFIAVLDAGSLVAAGRRLKRSAPAMTRAIASLEKRVGTRLLERTTRRLRATSAGEALAAGGRGLLSAYEELVRADERAELNGQVRVTAPRVFGQRHVAPLVVEFLDAHPKLSVDLLLDDREVNLVAEGVDLAVRIGRLADSGLIARRLGSVRRVLVAAPAYFEHRAMPLTPSDLLGHELVVSSHGLPEWRFGRPARERVVRLKPRFTVNSVEAALVAIRAGRAIGRALSYQVAEALESGTLLRVLPQFEPPALPVQLLVSGKAHRSARVAAFGSFVASRLATLEVLRALK